MQGTDANETSGSCSLPRAGPAAPRGVLNPPHAKSVRYRAIAWAAFAVAVCLAATIAALRKPLAMPSPLPRSGRFDGPVFGPYPTTTFPIASATGQFELVRGPNIVLMKVVPRTPAADMPAMQLQIGELGPATGGQYLPSLSTPLVLCDLNAGQADFVKAHGVPEGVVNAMVHRFLTTRVLKGRGAPPIRMTLNDGIVIPSTPSNSKP
jgi:hypothetical protein